MEKLFLGIRGHVVCLDKATGKKLWETKLKSTSGVTNLLFEDKHVFAYAGGHLFCVNAENGRIKWENKLDGYGYGACIIASENQNASLIADQLQAQQSSAATASIIAATASTSAGAGE
ncbi:MULTISPECIES: PQQ-binding-like beta-propeller repeat protein [Marisediminitalea]|jgi:outer membrane protein assembly factor BamB|uniref:outer membrane protein assembly factor BamB family protein n=1 Tax=Marisediminitalea TaxID=2662254 RepID=UPI0020CBD756|nr:PQQ-binding-like beta-propeller repeat protein [Marisediminitalea aggregata]MCP3865647.1 PQQ-binding-like beta-propeller repeat protein [Aestuariibacter sp.]MCP4524846.1 PQQ-binding-like beta-propeller repeat protein [Aestuariibacter sp.]MCP4946143.1 PQQ-binding-like beta-propeller repeat protein [Aestuariibacter sp.]MCP5012229.1 PQQ-binding-like beta-propeller repeat protein [Aestuariibacter sp.]MCP9477854.1 PQQ-like beta-propeller repeat protein [Marisediminitalea aggregata]|tara:strand:+ start:10367 stop:10720 length:354 start_codon:yes stop_codon:yes gene_type:complete